MQDIHKIAEQRSLKCLLRVRYDNPGRPPLLFAHPDLHYIIRFMTQLNLDQLIQKDEKGQLKCELLK